MKKEEHRKSRLKKKKVKFPSIYRRLTEKAPFLKLFINIKPWSTMFCLLLMLLIVKEGVQLASLIQQKQLLEAKHAQVQSEIKFWQDVAKEHPDYRDAYFNLAILEYKRGAYEKSQEYLQKTLSIDPSFEKGRELEKILNTNVSE